MTPRAGAALVAASAVYILFVAAAAGKIGAHFEEVVPYVLTSLDIRGDEPADDGVAPRFVTSPWLPRLAFEPTAGVRLPLLNQLYMTDHVSYGGVALAALGVDRLWAARVWHAAFGLFLLWLLYDVAVLLGLGTRAAVVAIAIAATGLQMTLCYGWARFDESLASFGTVTTLWAGLRYSRDQRRRWVWIGVFAAAIAVSGKVTALWSLSALGIAAALAGWRPPSLRTLAPPALAAAPLFAPIVGFGIAGPATGEEVGRRLGFLSDLFTSDAIYGTVLNLIDYLGSWGFIASKAALGADARGPNWVGRLLISSTLVWLIARTCAAGPTPRRRRLETQMLAALAFVVTFVALFFRQHRDYQFVLLVPLYALGLAAFLDWCAGRFLDPRLPAWAVGLLIFGLPVGSNLWEQRGLHEDLPRAHNAMADLGAQRASAAWLVEHGARHPIVPTFYAVGTYEILSDGVVQPVYTFPLFRNPKDRLTVPDYGAVWRDLLAAGGAEPQFAVLPVGENTIEATHFDETAIRDALLRVARCERAAVFANRGGEPLLEIWRATPTGSE